MDFQGERWGMDWIDLVQEWDRQWADVNAVTNVH